MMNRDWMNNALCRGASADLFFPDLPGVHGRRQAEAAAAVCAECPVTKECLEYRDATNSVWGVWGGDTKASERYYRYGRPA